MQGIRRTRERVSPWNCRTYLHATDPELVVPVRAGAVCGTGGEVVGPVSACVGDPADCGVDVHAEQVGQDGGGKIRCAGGEGSRGAHIGVPKQRLDMFDRSLTWVAAWRGEQLVGFVNMATDGGAHAFVLDTTVPTRSTAITLRRGRTSYWWKTIRLVTPARKQRLQRRPDRADDGAVAVWIQDVANTPFRRILRHDAPVGARVRYSFSDRNANEYVNWYPWSVSGC